MGYGPVINGKHKPITPWAGSWAATVNTKPMVQPSASQAVVLPHPVDVRGNPLPPRPKAPGSWL